MQISPILLLRDGQLKSLLLLGHLVDLGFVAPSPVLRAHEDPVIWPRKTAHHQVGEAAIGAAVRIQVLVWKIELLVKTFSY